MIFDVIMLSMYCSVYSTHILYMIRIGIGSKFMYTCCNWIDIIIYTNICSRHNYDIHNDLVIYIYNENKLSDICAYFILFLRRNGTNQITKLRYEFQYKPTDINISKLNISQLIMYSEGNFMQFLLPYIARTFLL